MTETDGLEELDALASKHESAEQAEQAERQADKEPEPQVIEASDEAAEMAAFAIGAVNSALALVEPRLVLTEQTEAARDECAPFIEKHELHKSSGAGAALRWWPEMRLGLFIGRYVKTVLAQLRALKADDEDNQETEHGEKREHQTTQQARAVSGADRVRQKPNPQAEGGNPIAWVPVD